MSDSGVRMVPRSRKPKFSAVGVNVDAYIVAFIKLKKKFPDSS